MSRYKDAVAERMQELKKLASTRKQRQENGQLLAAEGREKRKAIATRRAATICRLYKKYRHTYPSGRAGNAKTLRKVCRLHGPLPGKDNPITVQAVRAILKKSGIRCR